MNRPKETQDMIVSLIPLGMIFGGAVGVVFGMFFNLSSLVFTVSIGSGIGLLLGCITYGIAVGRKNHS